jgi:hypothetical protein
MSSCAGSAVSANKNDDTACRTRDESPSVKETGIPEKLPVMSKKNATSRGEGDDVK